MESLADSPVQVGDLVAGKYRVDRVLGRGGMGIVVAATHEQLGQKVALKFLLPEVSAHAEIVQRFVREARASVRIHSEHVARVLDVGTLEAGVPFMVMEFLEGEDLAQVLFTRGPLSPPEAVGYVLEACEAVAEAHSLGMVHRDLKPANLFLARRPSGRPTVKVLDFGISKVPTTDRDHAITRTSAVMGSPGYMSPEQMMSADKVDVRSDVWSLGVVLYELLGKRLPFLANTMPELIAAILQKAPEPLSAVRGDLPPGLLAVIDTCLQKDPAARYRNVADLSRALVPFGPPRADQSLERIEMVLGVTATSSPPPPMPPAPPGAGAVTPFPSGATFSPTTSQAARTPGRLVVPGVVAVALIAAVGGFFVLRARGGPAPSPSVASSLAVPPVAASVPSPSPSVLPSAAPALAASVSLAEPSTPTLPPVPAKPRPSSPAHPASPTPAPSTPPAPTPSCHVVSYFDADGNKHFKQECP